MKHFIALYTALDETTRTNEKVRALVDYFGTAPPADAAWALFFLSGRKLRQPMAARKLADWADELAGIPPWLFSESYDAVGDLAETIALLLPDRANPTTESDQPLDWWVRERLLPLRAADEATQRAVLADAWAGLDSQGRFVLNKLITGEMRVGVSQLLITRALAQVSGLAVAVVAHRLMGDWEPTADFYRQVVAGESAGVAAGLPYPFHLAYPLEAAPQTLGDVRDWQVEWKWDGIRAQMIRRAGRTYLWSRGEELISDRFPDLVELGDRLPDGTVLDGEILPWRDGAVLPFAQLQRRLGRKTLTQTILDEVPASLLAYDLLEYEGQDTRSRPLAWRRARLVELIQVAGHERLRLSPVVEGAGWDELAVTREESRARQAEGFMLKRLDAPYRVGRQRGDWWKWKIDPYTVDAVLIYAQPGNGKRASLFTDYTFGVWNEGALVAFAKAYSGLTDAEIREVDAFVRTHTVEKFGPVRAVTPELVFELGFEAIARSNRHKSGIAVRFPRILRWRRDKPVGEADSLETIRALVPDGTARSARAID
ncbi:MAG TPA: ATP-dependent DNA ligase [Chloroflexota bacterium]|nr:ATP-dependent DNA ligase [Chloroflexota bacterium]